MIKLKRLDHLVLTVSNLEKTIGFYADILGMERIEFADGRLAIGFGQQKINLHQKGNEYKPNAKNTIPGSADLCFITQTPVEKVIDVLESHQIEIIEGPVKKDGALGRLLSVYFRDPDGNLLEVSNYPDEMNSQL